MKIAAISIADYCHSTQGMDPAVERLYFRMILQMYSYEDGLPDDDRDNSRILGYRDVRTYKALKTKLLAWPKTTIYVEDGLIKNKRVEEELDKHAERRAQAVADGRRGGKTSGVRRRNARRSQKDQTTIGQRSTDDRHTISISKTSKINHIAEASPTPSPSPTPKSSITTVEQETARAAPRTAALPAGFDFEALSTRLFGACNGALDNPANCMGLLALNEPRMWLEQGCDLERDIIPTLTAAGKKHHGKRIRSWGFFTAMIAEAKARRERGLPSVDVREKGRSKRTKADELRELNAIVGGAR